MGDQPATGRIFISYRREDAPANAGRVFDRLESHFGKNSVFMDVDSIRPGYDFGQTIERALESCSVMLVVIGTDWLDAADKQGKRRLDDPDDFVLLEIRAGLDRGIPIIPVLVDGVPTPRRADLPVPLGPLARRHAVRVDNETFTTDITKLVSALEYALTAPAPPPPAPDPSPPPPPRPGPADDPDWTPARPGRRWPRWFYTVGPPPDGDPGRIWPTATDYKRAVQEAAVPVSADGLDGARLLHDASGEPTLSSGQNAVVFELSHTHGDLALRCFTRSPRDAAARYRALAALLASTGCDVVVPARWVDAAIGVRNQSLPAVVMPWVTGLPLNLAVENVLDQPHQLERLAANWLGALSELAEANLGHGDLQCGNVLVDDSGAMHLIDLDGFYLPSVANPPGELGHADFQHPRRTVRDWGVDMDGFSGLVIYLGLRALARDPGLWEFHSGENLVLARADYRRPGETPVWDRLRESTDAEVVRLTELLAGYCAGTTLPTMTEVLRRLVGEPALPDPDPPPEPAEPDDDAEKWWTDPEPADPDDDKWWDDDRPEPDGGPDVPPVPDTVPAPRRATSWFGRNAIVTGLTSGLVCAVLIIAVFATVGDAVPAVGRAPLLVGLAGAILAAALSAVPRMTMGAWRSGARAGLAGGALGALTSLGALLVFELATHSTFAGGRASALIIVPWILCALSIGVSAGVLRRSGRAVVSGLLGGLVGGLVGGVVHWASHPVFAPDGTNVTLQLHVLEAPTALAIGLACAAIGVSIGIVDRVRRQSWLTVIEGSLRGREIILDRRDATIGTADAATLRLARDAGVEPTHAVLTADGEGYLLRSHATVEVDGVVPATSAPVRLRSGNVLRVGGSFIRFEQRES